MRPSIYVATLSLVVGIGAGTILGRETEDIPDRSEQVEFCAGVAEMLSAMLSNAVDVVDPTASVDELQAAQQVQQENAAEARRKFGTDKVPEMINKCKEGE